MAELERAKVVVDEANVRLQQALHLPRKLRVCRASRKLMLTHWSSLRRQGMDWLMQSTPRMKRWTRGRCHEWKENYEVMLDESKLWESLPDGVSWKKGSRPKEMTVRKSA
jgi:hypothetical protein